MQLREQNSKFLLKNFKHSPSSLNLLRNAPQKFVAKKIFGFDSLANDNMKRGTVAEYACRYLLAKDPTDDQLINYIKKWWIREEGENDKNIQWIFDCAKLFAKGLEERQLKRPEIYQEKFSGKLPFLKYESHGFGDFTYLNNNEPYLTVDLKSTGAFKSPLPERYKLDHYLQQCFYYGFSGKKRKFALLYATNKRYIYFEIPKKELEEGWDIVQYNMRHLEKLDSMCKSKADWLNLFPYPDTDSFYFKDSGDFNKKIKQLYKGVIQNG